MKAAINNAKDKRLDNRFTTFIIIAQIIAIVCFAFLHYKSGKKYNNLVAIGSNNLDAFQKWTSNSNQNFIRLFEIYNSANAAEIDSIYKEWEATNQHINAYISDLSNNPSLSVHDEVEFKGLINFRKTYFGNVSKFVDLKRQAQANAQANTFFTEELKPSFINFQEKLGDYVKLYSQNIIDYNNQLYKLTNYSMLGILFVGFLPLLGLIIILILLFFYLLWVMRKLDFMNT
jgi:tyrosyl-tRNA synthetase